MAFATTIGLAATLRPKKPEVTALHCQSQSAKPFETTQDQYFLALSECDPYGTDFSSGNSVSFALQPMEGSRNKAVTVICTDDSEPRCELQPVVLIPVM